MDMTMQQAMDAAEQAGKAKAQRGDWSKGGGYFLSRDEEWAFECGYTNERNRMIDEAVAQFGTCPGAQAQAFGFRYHEQHTVVRGRILVPNYYVCRCATCEADRAANFAPVAVAA